MKNIKRLIRRNVVPAYIAKQLRGKTSAPVPRRYLWAYRNTGIRTIELLDRLIVRIENKGVANISISEERGPGHKLVRITVHR